MMENFCVFKTLTKEGSGDVGDWQHIMIVNVPLGLKIQG